MHLHKGLAYCARCEPRCIYCNLHALEQLERALPPEVTSPLRRMLEGQTRRTDKGDLR
jgi:hypothetical protein